MKFRKFSLLSLVIVFLLPKTSFSYQKTDKPKLIIIITLDQVRSDYIVRYDDAFTGGLKRLKDEGFYYEKGIVDHAPTLSWPGHTTIGTGAYPKTHGINSNDFILNKTIREATLQDRENQILGHPDSYRYSFSTKRLKVPAIGNWIRNANKDAFAVALSTGPALALCYSGKSDTDRSRNHAYWLDAPSGEFATSTYLRDNYPEWVEKFNREKLPGYKKNLTWENTVPDKFLHLARPDKTPYEWDEVHTSFPHGAKDIASEITPKVINRWFCRYSPYAHEALFDLAKEAVKTLKLGQRNTTDFLAVAVKITDRIGHDFGPHSLEQLDIILRIDRTLGRFFTFLDKTVGEGNYLVALTADHGAPNIVEYDLEQGQKARRVTEAELKKVLSDVERFIDGYSGPEENLPALIAAELEKTDFIARAMTPEQLSGTGPADNILQSYRNSYVPGRNTVIPLWTNQILMGRVSPKHPGNYGIIVEFTKNSQLYTAKSAHVSSYSYDQEVPILFMGNGIKQGKGSEKARTIDIAPTLAGLAGIKIPKTVNGKVLEFK